MNDQKILECLNVIVENNKTEVKDSEKTPSLKSKKKKNKRCKNCRKKPKGFGLSILQKCKYCSLQFCIKCSSPYDHNCSNLEKLKIEEKARLRNRLMSADCNFSKINRL